MPQKEIKLLSYKSYVDGDTPRIEDGTLELGGLYKLDSGEIVTVIDMKFLTKELARQGSSGSRSAAWSLPDYPPSSIAEMGRIYFEDYGDDDTEEVYSSYHGRVYLFSPYAKSIDAEKHDPTQYGGKAPEPPPPPLFPDHRIVRDLGDGFVVIRMTDVPAGVRRSGGERDADRLSTFGRTSYTSGDYVGPKSTQSPGEESSFLVLVKKSDLSPLPSSPVISEGGPKYARGNSGRTYNFETGNNPIDRSIGWKPIDLGGESKGQAFDPVAPVMAVHDLMEHFPGDEYDPHNEYMAQGAMLWLRVEGGFFGNITSETPPTHVANSVVKPAFGMLFYHINKGKLDTKEMDAELLKTITTTLPAPTYFALTGILVEANKYITQNISGTRERERLYKSLHVGVPWINLGYQRASERFAGLDKKKLVRLYQATVAQIENVKAGSKLSLTMHYDNYTADVSLSAKITL